MGQENMSKKSWPFYAVCPWSVFMFLHSMGQDFLDIQYSFIQLSGTDVRIPAGGAKFPSVLFCGTPWFLGYESMEIDIRIIATRVFFGAKLLYERLCSSVTNSPTNGVFGVPYSTQNNDYNFLCLIKNIFMLNMFV